MRRQGLKDKKGKKDPGMSEAYGRTVESIILDHKDSYKKS
jgi:hypothetical protein